MDASTKKRTSKKKRSLPESLMRVVRFLLLVVLLGEVFIAGVLLHYGELRVPQFAINKANKALDEFGYRVESDSIDFELNGNLLFTDFKLYHKDFPKPLLNAGLLQIDLSLWELLIGRLMIQDLQVGGGALYCPALYSPTGVQETLINDVYLDVEKIGHNWSIHTAQFKAQDLNVGLTGDFSQLFTLFRKQDQEAESEGKDSSLHFALLEVGKAVKQLSTLKHFKNPNIAVHLTALDRTQTDIEIALASQSSAFENGLSTGDIYGTLHFLWSEDGFSLNSSVSSITASAVRFQEDLRFGQTTFTLPTNVPLEFTTLEDSPPISYFTESVNAHGLSLNASHGSVDLKGFPQIAIQAFARHDNEYIDSAIAYNQETQSALVDITAYWKTETFFELNAIEENKVSKRFKIPDAIDCKMRLTFTDNFTFDSADFAVDSGRFAYRELSLEHLRAVGTFANDEVDVKEAVLVAKDYMARGSYFQNLKTLDYRFLLSGSIRPSELNNTIKEKWWRELWAMFNFKGAIPQSDIDIQGRYFGGSAHRKIFAFNQIQDFDFRGTALDSITGYLYAKPRRITLYDMQAKGTQGGETDIDFAFVYHPEKRGKLYTTFKGESSLPLEEAAQMCGDDVINIVDDFQLSALPKIKGAGILYDRMSDKHGQEFLKIQGDITAPFIYNEVHFDRGDFIAYSDPARLRLRKMNLGFAGGKAIARADLLHQGDSKGQLSLSFNLADAQYDKIKTSLPMVFKKKATDAEASKAPFEDGLINMQLSTQGEMGDFWTFAGKGETSVTDADFGQLHLLGVLSRTLYAVSVNVGTVKFEQAKSNFVLNKGNVYFPDLEITGQTARINASGNAYLPDETLDFQVNLSPFSEIQTPVVSQVLNVFKPLSNTIEMSLRGTIDEPEFKVHFKPLKAFTGTKRKEEALENK